MRRLLLSLLVVAGCAGSGSVAYRGTVSANVYTPDLVYVSPGVQVIADYDEPIFYADNYYWRYYDGRWYRSTIYTGGWVYATPPYVVARIERPYAYVRYRPHGYVARRPAYRDARPEYRNPQPYIRDHRNYRDFETAPQRQPQPSIRDHRTPTRDDGIRTAPPPRSDVRIESRGDVRERPTPPGQAGRSAPPPHTNVRPAPVQPQHPITSHPSPADGDRYHPRNDNRRGDQDRANHHGPQRGRDNNDKKRR